MNPASLKRMRNAALGWYHPISFDLPPKSVLDIEHSLLALFSHSPVSFHN